MASRKTVKPTHKAVKTYYAVLEEYRQHHVDHETAVRSAFQNLLAETARHHKWFLVPEQRTRVKGKEVIPDGTLRDEFNLHRGYWEAKDTGDDLNKEIRKKKDKGYPLTNTIFEDTRTGVLFQNGREVEPRFDLSKPQHLCDLLNRFYAYTEPDIEGFEQAVDEFKERVPELATALDKKIKQAHTDDTGFQEAFEQFFAVCQQSLNPNISRAAVDEMLIQHLLTERLIRKIFDRQDFVRRNVIAAEVEKVVDALTAKAISRHDFLKSLDRFYKTIELAAGHLEEFSEKQHFLNTIYERFFQGYSVKVADTHGIVYTPQEIVDFMCASVAEVLEKEFGLTLGAKGVNILDPCTGTGNFIVNLLRRIPKRDLPRMYKEQLFANEVMLLPYYIAALNIEHAYYEQTGTYEPFEGLCFVDTLDLAEGEQREFGFMTEENTQRVERQKNAPITVIIGNPPYNVGQLNENDNNKNRKYPIVEGRVRATYSKDSRASNKNALADAYVKFFRWSTDRIADRNGIVCLVSNNSFLEQYAFDGMRKHLVQDFTRIYHVDLEGNVRENPELAGTTYNVFGIQVGVGITVAVRSKQHRSHRLAFNRVEKTLRREEKLACLQKPEAISGVNWRRLQPDEQNTWLVPAHSAEYRSNLLLGTKQTKTAEAPDAETIFKTFSVGVKTNRDEVVYDFNHSSLVTRVQNFVELYNSEVDRFKRLGSGVRVDDFVNYDHIKWSRDLKLDLRRGNYADYSNAKIRESLFRPFCKRHLFFDRILNEEIYVFPKMLPSATAEAENRIIVVSDISYRAKTFSTLLTNVIADLHLCASVDAHQCFPFYVYDEDGSNRRENITDWALEKFQSACGDESITKWDIFYYVYGVLHHPGYREKFADNLKRELPRIPLAPDFRTFAEAGKRLAELHLDYEKLEPYELDWIESDKVPLSYRVEKMKLSRDKTALKVNDSLTLGGIPSEVIGYRLGNRSALDWVIDQYRIKTDKRSGITSDPNRADDPEYIVRLVGQVVRVSLETVEIIEGLPAEYAGLEATK